MGHEELLGAGQLLGAGKKPGRTKPKDPGAGRVVRQMDGFVVVLGYVKGSVRES